MWRRIGIVIMLAVIVAGCGAPPPPAPDALAVTPVEPATTPYGAAQPATPTPGAPAGSVHRSGSHGYDASFPQCQAGTRPSGARFSVVGVTGGKVFTADRCLRRLWRAGPRPRAMYVNSGYLASNRGRITPRCDALSRRLGGTPARRQAYALGCSAVVDARRVLRAAGIGEPAMWWIDVELANSWSERDVNLNRYELQGQIDQLDATGAPFGIYSTERDWQGVTGGWNPGGVDADWVAGVPVATACTSTGFSGDVVWLVQEVAPWPRSGYDSDWAC